MRAVINEHLVQPTLTDCICMTYMMCTCIARLEIMVNLIVVEFIIICESMLVIGKYINIYCPLIWNQPGQYVCRIIRIIYEKIY